MIDNYTKHTIKPFTEVRHTVTSKSNISCPHSRLKKNLLDLLMKQIVLGVWKWRILVGKLSDTLDVQVCQLDRWIPVEKPIVSCTCIYIYVYICIYYSDTCHKTLQWSHITIPNNGFKILPKPHLQELFRYRHLSISHVILDARDNLCSQSVNLLLK